MNLKTQLRTHDPVNLDLIDNIEIRQLLSLMLEKDPARRCSVIRVASDPWLTRNNGDPIDLDLSSISSKAGTESSAAGNSDDGEK